ncbi:MAG: CesD/SycD/LcrH family type III secretion system chaperone [Verrucomicrobia bacterium GWF2_51_19]|nr:MAG: CesD/SycD/LcrH family type III secretion system chaperone [Verrucomicrobia bacterium GWF2_51_19]
MNERTIKLETLDENIDDFEAIFEGILAGTVEVKALFGMNADQLEAFYSLGHHLYAGNKYDSAEKVFRGLCILDSMQKKYWLALAACLQMQERYEQAIEAYGSAFIIDAEDPEVYEQLAHCYIGTRNIAEAVKCLREVIRIADTTKRHSAIKERALTKLEIIEQSKK